MEGRGTGGRGRTEKTDTEMIDMPGMVAERRNRLRTVKLRNRLEQGDVSLYELRCKLPPHRLEVARNLSPTLTSLPSLLWRRRREDFQLRTRN